METGEQLLLPLVETTVIAENPNQLTLFFETPCQCRPGQACSTGHTYQECDQDCGLGA
ncbi:MAG TPA: hypothetical protein PK619_00610 [bacterium]|nr:hypothetical protein [bacterium]HNW09213.1 hypothetical protein [bacterium]HNZ73746.1 hypothetical protein [bacterium]HOH67445.1 hypothetical protein [bacterium]HPN81177.1 hypothetical protein [bacterium]